MQHSVTSPRSLSREAEEPEPRVFLIPGTEHSTGAECQPLSVARAVAAPVLLLYDDQFAHLSLPPALASGS